MLDTIEVYSFERADGSEMYFTTQDPRAAEGYAREHGARAIANKYRWEDSEPVSEWDFTE